MKKPPPVTTRKPHRPPKPSSPSNPAPGGLVSVHSRPPPGHGGGGKHGGTGKHQPPKKHKPPPKRKLPLGEAVACCSAEALAASLRLAGYSVADDDVLALYFNTAADPDEGATIEATLAAAQRYGLAGMRPAAVNRRWGRPAGAAPSDTGAALILGVTLPGGPHALCSDPSGAVWSWGELHDPGQLKAGPAEEAWWVTWAQQ